MLDNPKSSGIKKLAQLHRRKARKEQGLFLVEGKSAVRELLTHRPDLAKAVYIDYAGQGYAEIERIADEHEITLHFATPEVIAALSDTVTPQGIVAVAKQETKSLQKALKGAGLLAVMHEVRDPGNAGTVLRSADAAGADAVIFTGDAIDPFNSKVVRSTTGSIFHLPIVTGVSLEETAAALADAGINLFAADIGGTEITPTSDALRSKHAWLFGNEARGLTESELAHATASFKLPIFGAAESLNLATAASVCLYLSAFAKSQSA